MTSTLTSPRLTLRPIVPGDRDALVAILADKEAMAHMHYVDWDDAQHQAWVDTALDNVGQPAPDGILWILEVSASRTVVGWFGIGNPEDPANADDVSFEYALDRSYWNQGYMTEALTRILAYEFETLGVPQVSASCHLPNVGSARVMEKAGMRFTHVSAGLDMGGTWREQNQFRITRDEWARARQASRSR